MSRRSDLSHQQVVRRISGREEQFWEGCRPHCRSSLFHRDSVCEGQFYKGCRPLLRSSIREREDVEFARMYSELSWPKLRPKTPASRFSGRRPLPLSEKTLLHQESRELCHGSPRNSVGTSSCEPRRASPSTEGKESTAREENNIRTRRHTGREEEEVRENRVAVRQQKGAQRRRMRGAKRASARF